MDTHPTEAAVLGHAEDMEVLACQLLSELFSQCPEPLLAALRDARSIGTLLSLLTSGSPVSVSEGTGIVCCSVHSHEG
jgi:hypothetical protein